jgi:hypothetical protein
MGAIGTDDPTRQAEQPGRAPSYGEYERGTPYVVLSQPEWLLMEYAPS